MYLMGSQLSTLALQETDTPPSPNKQPPTYYRPVMRNLVFALFVLSQTTCAPRSDIPQGKPLPIASRKEIDSTESAESPSSVLPDGAMILPIKSPNEELVGLLNTTDSLVICLGEKQFSVRSCKIGTRTIAIDEEILPGIKAKDVLSKINATEDFGLIFHSQFGTLTLNQSAVDYVGSTIEKEQSSETAAQPITIKGISYTMNLDATGAAIYYPAQAMGQEVPPLSGDFSISVVPVCETKDLQK